MCNVSAWSSFGGTMDDSVSTVFGGRIAHTLTNRAGEETFVFWSLGDYLRRRVYEVKDQFDFVWNYVDPVHEEVEASASQNGCNLTFETAIAQTNLQGTFQDQYGNVNGPGGGMGIPACQIPQFQSCVTQSRQYITVAGVPFDHDITWSCYDVNVAR